MALINAGLEQRESAFVWLERAYDARDVHLIYLPWTRNGIRIAPIPDSKRSSCGVASGEPRAQPRRSRKNQRSQSRQPQQRRAGQIRKWSSIHNRPGAFAGVTMGPSMTICRGGAAGVFFGASAASTPATIAPP